MQELELALIGDPLGQGQEYWAVLTDNGTTELFTSKDQWQAQDYLDQLLSEGEN
jgi:hypothetical protein